LIGQALKIWPTFEWMAHAAGRVMVTRQRVEVAEKTGDAGLDGGHYLMTYMPVYS